MVMVIKFVALLSKPKFFLFAVMLVSSLTSWWWCQRSQLYRDLIEVKYLTFIRRTYWWWEEFFASSKLINQSPSSSHQIKSSRLLFLFCCYLSGWNRGKMMQKPKSNHLLWEPRVRIISNRENLVLIIVYSVWVYQSSQNLLQASVMFFLSSSVRQLGKFIRNRIHLQNLT